MPGDSITYFLWLIVCVALVIALAFWFTRFAAGRGVFGAVRTGKQMEVQGQLPLGRDQKLVLVQAGGRWLLLGVTAASITTLAEFTEEEAAAWREPPETAAKPGFKEALRMAMEQKKERR